MKLTKINNKIESREKIVQYLLTGDVMLHSDEERMMMRWMYADALIRGRRMRRDEIIEEIVKKFEVSKFTADADIRNAHEVFARTRTLNKKYLLGHLIEDLTIQIEKAKRDPEMKKILPHFYRELRTAINDLPEEISTDKLPPAVIMFNLFDPEKFKTGLTPEQAMSKAKEFLRKQEIDDIEHEDVT